ncbi:MAG: C40 family peptidase [Gammaproteobacteria bacterium]|nr:C40 family peptidase [Gammaproteobacteria bacterium]
MPALATISCQSCPTEPARRLSNIVGANYWKALIIVLTATLQTGCSIFSTAPSAIIPSAELTSKPVESVPASSFDVLGLVAYATSMQGKPYRSGGDSPSYGFDCSGLVYHVFAQFQIPLPRNARVMAHTLPEVSLRAIEAADLLFFDTEGPPFSHVGIYLGDGRFVHAPSPRTGRVIISDINNEYWHKRLSGARRPIALPLATVH